MQRFILVIRAITLLTVLVSMLGVGQQNAFAAGTLPCDIYASAGTPCVAAHSTTRALFGAYSGRLYQVKRTSNGATTDIGTLTAGGYANAAAQDSFCAGTTCTITIIYDQSSQHNNLTISGAGGNGGADLGAVANALPAMAGGHPVYGVYVTPGVGYRDVSATGTAVNGQAEGMYMVTSGTHVNGGCCFDYGNTEQPLANDTGNGHMDAVYFGLRCEHAPCSGSGPWIAADLENGLFQGNGSNTGDATVNFDVVTAMLKNNGQTTFALKTGNAQSGGLTTQYNGTLPNGSFSGYTPMHQEGGIVLGVGGDNSNSSAGDFYEGVMTSGYPTDAAENFVQANIVSVGYVVPTYNQVVPTSETTAQSWKYTTATPPSNWNTTGFSDSAWSTGSGGFGTTGTPGAIVRTTWSTADIWLRRGFNPGSLNATQISNLVFRLHHDEGAELYVNGIQAAAVTGYTTGYEYTAMTSAGQNAVIANGNNLLAVHVHQTTGGQYIDAGISLKVFSGGPAGYTFCANENGTCSFSGTAQVAYGANGVFNYGTFTTSVACNNTTFGDPIPGTVKACYYQPVGVIFYQDVNYGGAASAPKAKGDYAVLPGDIPNDWMSSLKVPAGWTVDAYADGGFAGAVCTYTADTSWVGSACNDVMSSFKIH